MPRWIEQMIENNPLANLGQFIKRPYRDITYFHGAGLHQDMIDYEGKYADRLTLYVYLDKVTEKQSPLYVMPRSHLLGPSTFPHNISLIEKTKRRVLYSNDLYENDSFDLFTWMSDINCASAAWHGLTLHGTAPTLDGEPRISLRYIIARGNSSDAEFASSGVGKILFKLKPEQHYSNKEARRDRDPLTGKVILHRRNILEEFL